MQNSQHVPSIRWVAPVLMAAAAVLCLPACSDDDQSPVSPAATEDPGTISLQRPSWSLASLTADPYAGGGGSGDGSGPRAVPAG